MIKVFVAVVVGMPQLWSCRGSTDRFHLHMCMCLCVRMGMCCGNPQSHDSWGLNPLISIANWATLGNEEVKNVNQVTPMCIDVYAAHLPGIFLWTFVSFSHAMLTRSFCVWAIASMLVRETPHVQCMFEYVLVCELVCRQVLLSRNWSVTEPRNGASRLRCLGAFLFFSIILRHFWSWKTKEKQRTRDSNALLN